ncbi:MAG: hypothetical protein U9P38_06625 [Campylobacterota bacterium]|nr:hypothetical protein [Campylobacterota bacterium]
MKYLLLLLFSITTLLARSEDTCYSVQVKSFYLKHNSSYDFHRQHYPSSCKLMKLSSMYAVRCGCFYNYNQAQNHLDKLSEIYYDAIIVNTYRYRFGTDQQIEERSQQPLPQKKRYKKEALYEHGSFEQRYNDIELEESDTREEVDYHQERSFDNDFEESDDLSEYGYE